MSKKGRWFICLFYVSIFLSFVPLVLHAAAWNQSKGKSQIINTFTYYTTKRFFDASGDKQSQLRFTKLEYNPYAEYGVSDTLTLGINPSYQLLSQASNQGNLYNKGLADIELFLRRSLWKNDTTVFSLQPLIKIPSLNGGKGDPALSNNQIDTELRLLAGHSIKYWGQYHFANLELAYRKRWEAPGDEIRADGTLGLRWSDKNMLLCQSFNTFSLSNGGGALQLANSSDFDLNKLQASYVREISERLSLQSGVFTHIAGKNTGAGGGFLVSLWVNL